MANETPVKDISLPAFVFMVHTPISGIVRSMIMGRFASPTCDLHNAVHIVWFTTSDLDLNCRMRNFEVVFQLFGDGAQHVLTASHALLFHRNMATTTNHARANCPNVEIMN